MLTCIAQRVAMPSIFSLILPVIFLKLIRGRILITFRFALCAYGRHILDLGEYYYDNLIAVDLPLGELWFCLTSVKRQQQGKGSLVKKQLKYWSKLRLSMHNPKFLKPIRNIFRFLSNDCKGTLMTGVSLRSI